MFCLLHHMIQVFVGFVAKLKSIFQIEQVGTDLIFDSLLIIQHLSDSFFYKLKILLVLSLIRVGLWGIFLLFWVHDLLNFVIHQRQVLWSVAFYWKLFLFALNLSQLFFEFNLFFREVIIIERLGLRLLYFCGLFLVLFKEALIDLDFVLVLNKKRQIWHDIFCIIMLRC